MPYTRTYKTKLPLDVPVPVDPETALAQLRWLARESFQKRAAAEYLRIVDYTERELKPEDLPPKVAFQLERPLSEFRWFEFVAVAAVDTDAVEAFTTACAEAAAAEGDTSDA